MISGQGRSRAGWCLDFRSLSGVFIPWRRRSYNFKAKVKVRFWIWFLHFDSTQIELHVNYVVFTCELCRILFDCWDSPDILGLLQYIILEDTALCPRISTSLFMRMYDIIMLLILFGRRGRQTLKRNLRGIFVMTLKSGTRDTSHSKAKLTMVSEAIHFKPFSLWI